MGIFGDGHYSEYLGGQWPVSQRERWGIDRRQSLCSSGLLLSASGSEILGALSGTRRCARGGLHYWQVAVRFRECEWSGVEVGVCAPEPGAPTPRAPTGLVGGARARALCRRWMCASEPRRATRRARPSSRSTASRISRPTTRSTSRPPRRGPSSRPATRPSTSAARSARARPRCAFCDAPLPRDTTACDVIGVLLDLRRRRRRERELLALERRARDAGAARGTAGRAPPRSPDAAARPFARTSRRTKARTSRRSCGSGAPTARA